jgi:ABC-2 type transport system permease protein
VRAELARQLRRRRTWVGLGGMAAVPVVLAVAFLIADAGSDAGGGRPSGDPTGLFALATASGPNFALMATAAAAPFLLMSVVALFAGDTVSSEASWGSLRSLLVRPVPRSTLLGRKLAAALTLSGVAAAVVPASGLLAGTLAYGWGPLVTPFGALGTREALLRIAAVAGYAAWSGLWVATLAFALSTATDTSVGAVAGTIVILIVVQILDAITALGTLRTFLPVHEGLAWLGLLAPEPRWADLSRGILLQLPWSAAFAGTAWWWFGRKDVLS